ncbi:phosphohydrolase [Desulfolithobacter dissulfuricans]|uniref:Phosphohydrolase n=1 Tax=Desulfolithobacter dissulfuricans TaxID=2795293 RepID=A0A915U2L3_9BACT|nr:HD domain-containing protein [Desulfolithobacter dissulfuricans]BCO10203.1 phosphohydrolase [Desulfolithobacter dissulfuricans]
MSSILDADRLKILREISAGYCMEEGGPHGPDHSERVYRMAMNLGRELSARLDILGAAALLHDIGRRRESESRGIICHAEIGADMAVPVLQGLDFPEADIKEIVHCIRAHRYRGREKPASLEAAILFDADKLDSIGAIGIGRAFLFAGQIGARLHNPELAPEETESYTTEDTAYREFQVKMSRVRDQMLTEPGRRLARRRHEFMEIFFDELNREIYGNETDPGK